MAGEEQASEAAALKGTLAPHSPAVLLTLIDAGQMMDGAVLSCTTMVRLQEEELPQSSEATQVRVTL